MTTNLSERCNVGPMAVLSLLLACGLTTASAANAAICRVDAFGGQDGSSWALPIRLQAALTSANCTEIWVKAGTYTPGAPRTTSFKILPGVKVYGGFFGTEIVVGQRNPAANPTTLSGDIGVVGNISDNNLHVVYMDGTSIAGGITASTVLDGFTVRAGNANGTGLNGRGGGLLCYGDGMGHECSPTIVNVTFDSNSAVAGGAVNATGDDGGVSSPSLSSVVFSNNNAGIGGAFYNAASAGDSSPNLNFVKFVGNHSSASGGAIFSSIGGSSSGPVQSVGALTLTNVSFSANTAGGSGGAMFNEIGGVNSVSLPLLSSATFEGNQAIIGGAMYNESINSTLRPTLSNVTFSGNSANNGGAIFNSVVGGNVEPVLSNVTFSGNSAVARGGAIYNGSQTITSNPGMRNVIAWGNSAGTAGAEIFNDAGSTTTIQDTVVQGGCPTGGITNCINVIDTDPLLGVLQDNGGFTQTRMPGAGSSSIDAGNDSVCAMAPVNGLDQRGVIRPVGPRCDIGAVEVGGVDLIFRSGFDTP